MTPADSDAPLCHGIHVPQPGRLTGGRGRRLCPAGPGPPLGTESPGCHPSHRDGGGGPPAWPQPRGGGLNPAQPLQAQGGTVPGASGCQCLGVLTESLSLGRRVVA